MTDKTSSPLVCRTIQELRTQLEPLRRKGTSIGLVPTMGALHEGHLSLIDASNRECDFTVATIFVNPTQFAPGEDFDKYPRTYENDLQLLASRNTDLLFAPEPTEVYPEGFSTTVTVDGLMQVLEGKHRPTHFQGVTTVVCKLFNMVQPNVAFFGQKDFQQALIIRRMTTDLDLPITVRICPIVRDEDGLALSSRNRYLSPDERQKALTLSQSLQLAQQLVRQGVTRTTDVLTAMLAVFKKFPDIGVDYIAIANPETLTLVESLDEKAIALVAVRVGNTRLIDNLFIEP